MKIELSRPDWMDEGSCSGMAREQGNYDLFFEEKNQKDAKKVCETCPVRRPCLEYAIECRIEEGVWGGLTYSKRRRLWRYMHRNEVDMDTALGEY